jgi:hypothetical protein
MWLTRSTLNDVITWPFKKKNNLKPVLRTHQTETFGQNFDLRDFFTWIHNPWRCDRLVFPKVWLMNYHCVLRDSPEELSFRCPCPLSQFQGHIDEHQEIPFKVSYIMPLERSGANLGTFHGKFKRDSPEELSFRCPCPLSKFQGHIDEHQEIPFKLSYVTHFERIGANLGPFQGKFKLRALRYAGRGRYVDVSTAHNSGFLEDSAPVRNTRCLIIFLGEVWRWKSAIDIKADINAGRKSRHEQDKCSANFFLKVHFLLWCNSPHRV